MTIKDLCKKAHKMAVEKGFWDGVRTHDENGKQYPKGTYIATRNISELLMLIVTELAEACEALRHNKRQGKQLVEIKKQKVKVLDNGVCLGGFQPYTHSIKWEKDTFEDELADTFIRLGDMCEALGIDIEWQIKKKMEYNSTRPQKHGKKF